MEMESFMRSIVSKMDTCLNKVDAIGRKIEEKEDKKNDEIQNEARELLAGHFENLKHTIDDSYEEMEDPPRELDETDKKDKKVMDAMIKILDGFIESLDPSDENEESGDDESNEEEGDADDEDEDEDEEEEDEPQNKKRKTQSGKGQYGDDSFNIDNRIGQWPQRALNL